MKRAMTADEQTVWDMAMNGTISMSKAIQWATDAGATELANLLRAS